MTDPRFRKLDNVHNLRDFGGFSATGGTTVKRGLLWRAGHQAGASESDREELGLLGLTHIVDLRGAKERQRFPNRPPAGKEPETIAFEGETAGLAPHAEAAKDGMDEEEARRTMVALYANLPNREGLNAVLPRYFTALAEGKGGSLVHCAAGKDRTGIAADLVLHSLGVHPDDRMEDYLLTNEAPDNERRIEEGLAMVGKAYRTKNEAAGRILMGVQPEYLEAARASLVQAEGSIDAYLERRWGVDGALRAKMRGYLCE